MVRQKAGKNGYSPVETTDSHDEHPEDELAPPRWRYDAIGCLSAATFQWVTPIFKLGMRRQIDLQDLPDLQSGDVYSKLLRTSQLRLAPNLRRLEAALLRARQRDLGGGGGCLDRMRSSLIFVVAGVFVRDMATTFALDGRLQPWASLPLSPAIHLNVLNSSY
jgi:hypothetical protein